MVPELRARGVVETLDLAVALYRAQFLRVLVRAACVMVPVQALSTVILLSAQPTGYTVNFAGQPSAQSDTRSALLLLTATLADRKSTRLNSSHSRASRMPSSA